MATIDNLDIKIKVDTASANRSLTAFNKRLSYMSTIINNSNVIGLSDLATGIDSLTKSLEGLNNINGNTSKITKLLSAMTNLSNTTVDTSKINSLTNSVNLFVNSMNTLPAVGSNATKIGVLAGNIAKLGGTNVKRAITNIPLITTELKNLITTLASLPKVSKNITTIVSSLAQFNNQIQNGGRRGGAGGGASGGSSGGASGSGSTSSISRFVNGIKSIFKHSNNSAKSMFSLASAIGRFYATWFLAIRAVKGIWNSVKSSMDYVETYNYYSVTMAKLGKDMAKAMGDTGEEAGKQYTESFTNQLNTLTKKMTGYNVGSNGELVATGSNNLGLDPEQLMNFQAKVSAITNSAGLLQQTSVDTAKALSMLSSDLSSLTNTDLDTTMTNLSSGLIGQSRALYKYGIDITNATLSEYALANGITKSVSAMTQSEKMQLRLLAILDQSKVAWGDQANTVNSVNFVAA